MFGGDGFLSMLNPLDIVIGAIAYLIGRYVTQKGSNRAVGIFLQVSILLIRITKHYFDTHPDALKVAHKYKTDVDKLYHAHVPGSKPPDKKTVG